MRAVVVLLLLLAGAGVRRVHALPTEPASDPEAACVEGICLPPWLAWLLGPVGWGVAVAVVVGGAGAGWYLWVRRQVRSLDAGPMLVLAQGRPGLLPIAGAEAEVPGAGPRVGGPGRRRAPLTPGLVPGRGVPAAGAQVSSMPVPTRDAPVVPIAGGVHAILVSEVSGAATPAPPVPVADATLQFLPGRLEAVGERRRPDLRFVRQPGAVTEVTLGRQAGPPDRHVRLESPTVSRLHARLRHAGGRWTITNLSRTNPVRVNGRALGTESDTHLLAEGDRVEVGELVLVFRER